MLDVLNSGRFWIDSWEGVRPPFLVTMSGLAGGYAEIGGAAVGYATTIGGAPSGGVAWSASADPAAAATYGTGASPTDFSAGDGATLYLHVTHLGVTVSRAAVITFHSEPLSRSLAGSLRRHTILSPACGSGPLKPFSSRSRIL